MPAPLQLNPLDSAAQTAPVMGISEWMCYHANYDMPSSGVSDLDACLDAHIDIGIDQIVWNVDRSVVDYWSDLPNVTQMCEQNDQVGGISWSFVAAVMDSVCPLRYALSYCRERQIPLLGRLGMNRHYGNTEWAGVTSRFALENPHYRERSILGNEIAHKLCYAIEEVRQYRTGADAMTLYQSETLARMDYLKETLRKIGDRQLVAQKAADLSDPNFPSVHPIGLDWHSRLTGGHGLGLDAGDGAL